MNKLLLVLCSAIIVTIADTLIKRVSTNDKYALLIWCLVALFYILQSYVAYLLFKRGADLGLYSCIFVVFYAIFCCLNGHFLYNETISARQYVGIIVSLIGAALLVF